MRAAASPSDAPLPEAILDAAIVWAVRLDYNAPTDSERHAFERWLEADPRRYRPSSSSRPRSHG